MSFLSVTRAVQGCVNLTQGPCLGLGESDLILVASSAEPAFKRRLLLKAGSALGSICKASPVNVQLLERWKEWEREVATEAGCSHQRKAMEDQVK